MDCIKRFYSELNELGEKWLIMNKKKWHHWQMIKIGTMKSKKNATSVKKSFAIIRIKYWNLNYAKELEIIVILQGNLEDLLIAFVI